MANEYKTNIEHMLLGYYIKYDNKKFKNGDNARTIIVYNPCTNYIDDVICRIDMVVK